MGIDAFLKPVSYLKKITGLFPEKMIAPLIAKKAS